MKTIVEGHATAGGRTSRHGCWRLGLLACLLVGLLLAAVPATAGAATPEMRGEWELVMKSGSNTLRGKTVIREEANAKEEFSSLNVVFEFGIKGTFSGTLEGSKATVLVTAEGLGPVPSSRFESNEMAVNSGATPTISGSGTLTFEGQPPSSATLVVTRIKTYQQVEEQEAQERREAEEAEERKNVRGEWELVLTAGPMSVKGLARIKTSADTASKFASSSALFEGSVPGTFSGTLGLTEATVEVTSEAFGGTRFTSSEMAVASSPTSMSMAGNGTLQAGSYEGPASLTATRVKTYAQLVEAEAQEKLAAEAKEREERETREALERQEREQREREAAAKQSTQGSGDDGQAGGGSSQPVATTLSARPTGKTFAVSSAGVLSLSLANPNALAANVRVTVLSAMPIKAKSASGKRSRAGRRIVLASGSSAISAEGQVKLSLELTRAGRALLAKHRSLAAIVKVVTQVTGQAEASTSYRIVLRAKAPSRRHG